MYELISLIIFLVSTNVGLMLALSVTLESSAYYNMKLRRSNGLKHVKTGNDNQCTVAFSCWMSRSALCWCSSVGQFQVDLLSRDIDFVVKITQSCAYLSGSPTVVPILCRHIRPSTQELFRNYASILDNNCGSIVSNVGKDNIFPPLNWRLVFSLQANNIRRKCNVVQTDWTYEA